MKGNCSYSDTELLSRFLAGELSLAREVEVELHIEKCPECARMCDLILEDPNLENEMSCLAAPDGMSQRAVGAIPVRRRSFHMPLLRITTIAAILLIGISLGTFIPIDLGSTRGDALAASISTNIAGYSRGAKLLGEEIKLLPKDPRTAAIIIRGHLMMFALPEIAEIIVRDFESPYLNKSEVGKRFLQYRDFFIAARDRIASMTEMVSDNLLSSEEYESIIEYSDTLLPKDGLSDEKACVPLFETRPIDFKSGDSAVDNYLLAKKLMLSGMYFEAANYLLSSFEAESPVRDVSGYWLTIAYEKTDRSFLAEKVSAMLPPAYRRGSSRTSPYEAFTFGSSPGTSYYILILSGEKLNRCPNIYVLKREDGSQIVVGVGADQSVVLQESNGVTEYSNIEDLRNSHPDIYMRIFPEGEK